MGIKPLGDSLSSLIKGIEFMLGFLFGQTNLGDSPEAYDKNGHWFRLVPARGQTGWLWVERWASDYGYRLVAAKANTRVYRKNVGAGGIYHFAEIRLRDGRLRVGSWLQADLLARAVRFFQLPMLIVLEPVGFWGIRARRTACRNLNDLMARFEQEPIYGSTRFHLADWDPTTWALIGTVLFLISGSLTTAATAMDAHIQLLDDHLFSLGKMGAILAILAFASIFFYERYLVRKYETVFPRLLGMAGTLALVVITGWQLVSPTQLDMLHSRVRYYCVEARGNTEKCHRSLEALPANEREQLARNVNPQRPQALR